MHTHTNQITQAMAHHMYIYKPFPPRTHTHTHTHTHTLSDTDICMSAHTHTQTHTSSGGNYAFKRIFKSKNLQLTEGKIYINIYKDRKLTTELYLTRYIFIHTQFSCQLAIFVALYCHNICTDRDKQKDAPTHRQIYQ